MKRKDEQGLGARLREAGGEVGESEVIAWLRAHPDFFRIHEELLGDINLPHRAGSAVSLVERQVSLLRERNIESRKNLARLLDTARENDALFAKTRQLVLGLLECRDRAQLRARLAEACRQDFGAPACRLLLSANAALAGDDCLPAELPGVFGEAVNRGRIVTGPLRPRERSAIFGEAGQAIESAALVPLGTASTFGLLAIGSEDARQFQNGMGTLFLEFIGDVLQRLLPRLPAAGGA